MADVIYSHIRPYTKAQRKHRNFFALYERLFFSLHNSFVLNLPRWQKVEEKTQINSSTFHVVLKTVAGNKRFNYSKKLNWKIFNEREYRTVYTLFAGEWFKAHENFMQEEKAVNVTVRENLLPILPPWGWEKPLQYTAMYVHCVNTEQQKSIQLRFATFSSRVVSDAKQNTTI